MDIVTVATSILSSSFISSILVKYIDRDFKIEQFKLDKLLKAEQELESLKDNQIYYEYNNIIRNIFEKNRRFLSVTAISEFEKKTNIYDDDGHIEQSYADFIEDSPDEFLDFKYILLNIIRDEINREIHSPVLARIINAFLSNFNYIKMKINSLLRKENHNDF